MVRTSPLFGPCSPLEIITHIFARAEVNQQLIEALRCRSQGLPIGVRSILQHLSEATCRSLQRLQFCARDLFLGTPPDGPNQG